MSASIIQKMNYRCILDMQKFKSRNISKLQESVRDFFKNKKLMGQERANITEDSIEKFKVRRRPLQRTLGDSHDVRLSYVLRWKE